MPTIHDVARMARISTAAVSLVMNDHNTSRVSAARRRQILKIAEEIGYAPNGLAKALLHGETRIIGLIVPMRDPIFFNYFIAEVLSGIQACLIERGYHLMIYSHGADTGRVTRNELMQSRYVDGVIVVQPLFKLVRSGQRVALLAGTKPLTNRRAGQLLQHF